jgi:hypothetical protein
MGAMIDDQSHPATSVHVHEKRKRDKKMGISDRTIPRLSRFNWVSSGPIGIKGAETGRERSTIEKA